MVKKFLKIAGVKNEQEFYKKYPSEAAFFKAHPEAKDLKQYKQGGQQKKLNQLTSYQGDIDEMIPTAQYGCKGKSCTQTGEGITKVGADMTSDGSGKIAPYIPLSNAPVTWNELQTYNETNPKSKEFKNRLKTLQGQFPGLTQEQLLAAGADSARIKQRINDLPKWDKPENQTYDRNWYPFYRNLMKPGSPVTVDQILQMHQGRPGGIGGYQQTVEGNYKQKKGGKTPKAQNALTTGNTPSIQSSSLINPFDPSLMYGNQTLQGTSPIGGQTPSAVQSMAMQGAIPLQQLPGTQIDKPLDVVNPKKFDWDKAGKMAGPIGGIVGKIGKGIQANKAEKKAMLQANQQKLVSDVALQAASTTPEQTKRKYSRPEDMLIDPNQTFPTMGVGTNVLAQYGATIGGNPTEIQNMYNPGDIYSDLGFEPLNDSNIVKQYRYGGVRRAQSGLIEGLGKFGGAGGFDAVSKGLDMIPGMNNAGSQIGEGIGDAVGMIPGVGTVAKPIIKMAGKVIGAALDRKPQKTKKFQEQTMANVNKMGLMQGAASIQSANQNFMEDGGWVSHDWQPQVIARFGEYDVSDLLQRDPMMDTLRTGGNIRNNYMSQMDQFALGGEVKTHWGGYAEQMSQNPYLPGSGETIMFRGQSHSESDGKGRTGIGVSYGDTGNDSYTDYAEYGTEAATDKAQVEVERNEPAVELPDENGQNSMVVYGNLMIPDEHLSYLGDPNAKGKKFKNYVKDLTKIEDRQNKIIEKNTSLIDGLTPLTTFDRMKLMSAYANINGANMKLKDIAGKKIKLSGIQSAINDTAEEYGIDADALAKGNFKVDKNAMNQAKFGANIETAQKGKTKYKPDNGVETILPDGRRKRTFLDGTYTIKSKGKLEVYSKDGKLEKTVDYPGFNTIGTHKMTVIPSAPVDESMYADEEKPKDVHYPITPRKKDDWMDFVNAVEPYLRPTDQEAFDMAQLYPEMFAMSSNQLEPVPAELYRPQLKTPYDISLQDILNENEADFNAAQRMTGYNPGARGQLSAQKYAANQKVLGEQFRLNQANRAQTYGENINTLNDAQLKNLGILQDQYAKQAQAKSNTKATTQEALNSIADKIAKHKLENRTLGVMENLYNFRFDKSGRAININPLWKPTIGDVTMPKPVLDDKGNIIAYMQSDGKKISTTTNSTTARNGNIVRKAKGF